jgi:hypothetical protein
MGEDLPGQFPETVRVAEIPAVHPELVVDELVFRELE